MRASLRLLVLLALVATDAGADTVLAVDPDAGNNTLSAVFDAVVGERITALTSDVGCTLHVDEATRSGRAVCSVPLTAIRVDNDDTKTDHFRQWVTNEAVDARACALELVVPRVTLATLPEPLQPAAFDTVGTVTVCGRPRDDGGGERIVGTVVRLAPGAHDVRTLRIRARIERFDRERYRIGPRWTPGWLARVQELAPVVATDGVIEVTLFATEVRAPRRP